MKRTLFELSISFFEIKNEMSSNMRDPIDLPTGLFLFVGGKREEMIWDDSPDFQFDIKMISKFFLSYLSHFSYPHDICE